jgi:hypothetical protein
MSNNIEANSIAFVAMSIPFAIVCLCLYRITRKEKLIKKDYLAGFFVSICATVIFIATSELLENRTSLKLGSLRYFMNAYMIIQSFFMGILTSVFMRNFSK